MCNVCASHVKQKELREDNNPSSSVGNKSTNVSPTCTLSLSFESSVAGGMVVPFPEMSAQNVVQLANLETENRNIRKSRTAAEKRQGIVTATIRSR